MDPRFDANQIGELCRRHRIKRLAVFGSAARGEMRTDSDVDLLVEFEPGVQIGYLGLGFVADDFSKVLGGHRIDLVSPTALNARIRDRVLAEAKPLYDALPG